MKSGKENVFTANLSPTDYETQLTPKWILSGEGADTRLQIVEPTLTSCKVKVLDATPGEYSLKLELSQDMGGKTIVSDTFSVTVLGEDIVMTSVSNPRFMRGVWRAGFSASQYKLTQEEADKIIEFPEGFCEERSLSSEPIESIEPLQYFHNLRRIGKNAFSGFGGEGRLIIPDSVEEILSRAFAYTSHISGEVILPKGLRILDEEAFRNSGIESITIPEGITEIKGRLFYGCSNLTRVVLPTGVTTIGYEAFSHSGIESIEVPSSVTEIKDYAFSGSKLKKITLPLTVIKLGQYCFSNSKLESFHLTANIEASKQIFEDCKSLKELIIGNGVKKIPYLMCYKLTSLTSVIFPEGLTEIGSSAFKGCTRLTNVTFPEGLKKIGERAFEDCKGITSVTFPESINRIDGGAFMNTGVTEVTWKSLPPQQGVGLKIFDGCTIDIDNYHYPEITDRIPDYFFSNVRMKNGTFPIPETVTQIRRAFNYSIGITHLSIPPAAIRPYELPYYTGTDIEEFSVQTGIKSLGGEFADCKKLRKVTLPEDITSLEDTFAGCSALESITIPESVTYLNNAFKGCVNLKTIICKPQTAPRLSRTSYDQTVGGYYVDRYGACFGVNDTSYTGRNTYSTGENRLIVPVGASCYTWGDWGDILLNKEKCGFTLQQTL